jgi:hypothetical protein
MRKRVPGEMRVVATGEAFGQRAEVWTGTEWLLLPHVKAITLNTVGREQFSTATIEVLANMRSEP